jgi:DNA replication protein DnaC/primosomal protein DnaI
MDTRGLSEDDLLSKYGGCDLLVLDDLGKGKQTEWSVALLYRLVNRRYEDMLPTVYTSQYDLEALQERLTVNGDKDTAEAIVDRLHETCRTIRLGDVNRRRSLGF